MITVTDCRMDERAVEKLSEYGFYNISLKPWSALPGGIASHPDMLIFVLDDILLTHIDYYQCNNNDLRSLIRPIMGLK